MITASMRDFVAWITSSKKYATASPRTQKMLFAGFEAGRQTFKGEPVAEVRITNPNFISWYVDPEELIDDQQLYTHPARRQALEGEAVYVLLSCNSDSPEPTFIEIETEEGVSVSVPWHHHEGFDRVLKMEKGDE